MVMPWQSLCDTTKTDGLFEAGPISKLADCFAIDGLPGRCVSRHRGNSLRLPPGELFIVNQHVAAPGIKVDTNMVAGFHPSQAATGGALRRGVED